MYSPEHVVGYGNFLTAKQPIATTSQDKGVSCQLWAIRERLKQLDDAMTPARQARLQETHPELVFLRLNDGRELPSKKLPEGIEARRRILCSRGFSSLHEWLACWRKGSEAAADDVLDACACAIAALDPKSRIPEQPEIDPKGLRMEMWY